MYIDCCQTRILDVEMALIISRMFSLMFWHPFVLGSFFYAQSLLRDLLGNMQLILIKVLGEAGLHINAIHIKVKDFPPRLPR